MDKNETISIITKTLKREAYILIEEMKLLVDDTIRNKFFYDCDKSRVKHIYEMEEKGWECIDIGQEGLNSNNIIWLDYALFKKNAYKTKKEKNMMNFGDALKLLKEGERIQRKGWNGKGMYLSICDANISIDEYKMQDFIYLKTAKDTLVPWVVSQDDVLAEDYIVVERCIITK